MVQLTWFNLVIRIFQLFILNFSFAFPFVQLFTFSHFFQSLTFSPSLTFCLSYFVENVRLGENATKLIHHKFMLLEKLQEKLLQHHGCVYKNLPFRNTKLWKPLWKHPGRYLLMPLRKVFLHCRHLASGVEGRASGQLKYGQSAWSLQSSLALSYWRIRSQQAFTFYLSARLQLQLDYHVGRWVITLSTGTPTIWTLKKYHILLASRRLQVRIIANARTITTSSTRNKTSPNLE